MELPISLIIGIIIAISAVAAYAYFGHSQVQNMALSLDSLDVQMEAIRILEFTDEDGGRAHYQLQITYDYDPIDIFWVHLNDKVYCIPPSKMMHETSDSENYEKFFNDDKCNVPKPFGRENPVSILVRSVEQGTYFVTIGVEYKGEKVAETRTVQFH